jgi:hypothetical protein
MKKAKLVASLKNFVFAIVFSSVIYFIPVNGGPLAFLKVLLQNSAFLYLFISLVLLLMRLVTYPFESKNTPIPSSAPSDSNLVTTPVTNVETNFLAQFAAIFSLIFFLVFALAIWIIFQIGG